MSKPKIAIFDLTDCEGCELQFIALREKLIASGDDFDITNWRLGAEGGTDGPFDVTFIEGSPISESDIEVIKRARAVSKKVVTLGICADLGGVQSMIPESARAALLSEVYKKGYKSKSRPPKPVSYYIDVDIHLPGCPVNPAELERLLSCLLTGKKFIPAYAPVCLECKARGNACLFLDQGFCMGPVTKGGCGAPCPSVGLHCYGCFGPMPDANLEALRNVTKETKTDSELDSALRMFFRHSDQYKVYKTKKKGKK